MSIAASTSSAAVNGSGEDATKSERGETELKALLARETGESAQRQARIHVTEQADLLCLGTTQIRQMT
jgi:hypothetical protein